MVKSKEIVQRVTQMVVDKDISPRVAAGLLEANVRTVYNYVKKYSRLRGVGFVEHRGGHHRKLSLENEQSIAEYKRQKPERSACWIRNRLKLNVSVECVRKVLVKYDLNYKGANGQTSRKSVDFVEPSRKSNERHNLL